MRHNSLIPVTIIRVILEVFQVKRIIPSFFLKSSTKLNQAGFSYSKIIKFRITKYLLCNLLMGYVGSNTGIQNAGMQNELKIEN
jgi:hypothetical protein